MKYVVTKTAAGEFSMFCAEESFRKHPELYLDDGDTYEVFDGPEYDGNRATFERVRELAKASCTAVSEGVYDEQKFAALNQLLRALQPGGLLDVHHLRVLGDTYEELTENLYRIADAGVLLRITPRKVDHGG